MNILYEFDPAQFVLKPGATVPSPCVNICRMDEKTGLCSGCYRNIDEIICWSKADNHKKLEIWDLVQQRMLP
ncbi:DUF1289 domain-containing protein [Undibacterium sp. TC9W]|uniref:DUF1289 domain-containing protein n=1 Tax=Undibacterium sp. TC9W TaxID=3413053 RepID=UPI003BF361DE